MLNRLRQIGSAAMAPLRRAGGSVRDATDRRLIAWAESDGVVRLRTALDSPTVRGAIILVTATILVVVWLAGLRAASGTNDSGSTAAELEINCLLGVSGGTISFAPEYLETLEDMRVAWKPIAPAVAVGERAVRLGIRGGSGVPCHAIDGVITSRGGFALVRRADRRSEFRRLRIDVAAQRMEAVPEDPDAEPLPVAAVDLRAAQRVETGGQLGVVVTMTVAPLYADAVNETFGTALNPGSRLGTLRLSVREVAPEDVDGR